MSNNDYKPGSYYTQYQAAEREARRRRGLAEVTRLQRWFDEWRRLQRELTEAEQRRRERNQS